MTYKNLILLFILIYAAKSLAQENNCYFKTAEKIYYAQKAMVKANDLSLDTDCPDEILAQVSKELLDVSGTIPSSYIEEKIPGVTLSPNRLTIDSLENLIRAKLALDESVVIDQVRGTGKNIFLLASNEQLNFSPPNQILGQTTIAVEKIDALNPGQQKFWLSVIFKNKVMALVAKQGLDRANGALKPEWFKRQEIVTEYPDRVFVQFDRINHFSLNRSIAPGHILLRAEARELPLVTYGVPASVLIEGKGIQLNGMALPMKTANFGDYIQLKNPRSQKTISAKVVDYNKVQIQL